MKPPKKHRLVINLMRGTDEDFKALPQRIAAFNRHNDEARRLRRLMLVKRPKKDAMVDEEVFNASVDHALGIDDLTFPRLAGIAMVEARPTFFMAAAAAARAVAEGRITKPKKGDAHVMALLQAKLQIEAKTGIAPTKKDVRSAAIIIFQKWFSPYGLETKKTYDHWKDHFKAAGLDYLETGVRGPAAEK